MLAQTTNTDTQGAVSNTALESQSPVLEPMSAKVDWISLSFKVSGSRRLDKLIETIQDMLGISVFFDECRVKDDYTGRYQSFNCTLGCTFSYSSFDSNDVCNARLTLPGQFLADRKPWHIKRVCRRLRDDWAAVCTRIDLAVDDYAKQLDYQVIINATKNKDCVGFRSGKTVESYGTQLDGKTVYCGSRRSPKFARFYNKGEFDRFEIEYKQHLASAVFCDYLADLSPDSSLTLSSILRSSISFVNKRDRNLSRATDCDWWLSFQSRIVGSFHPLNLARPRPSLDRTLKWIHRSVSKSLLLMREALGELWMEKLIQLWEYEARGRTTAKDIDNLNQFRQHGFSLSDLMNMI
jgi:Replication initiation factor